MDDPVTRAETIVTDEAWSALVERRIMAEHIATHMDGLTGDPWPERLPGKAV